MGVQWDAVAFILGLFIGFFVGKTFQKLMSQQGKMMKKVVKDELFKKGGGHG